MRDPDHPPAIEIDAQDPARLRLLGQWTLAHANDIGECLRGASGPVASRRQPLLTRHSVSRTTLTSSVASRRLSSAVEGRARG